jgi:hypothetical protein
VTTQADGTREQIARGAAALTNEALAAARTLVDGLGHHRPAPLELLAQALQVGRAGLVTQAEGLLLMGTRAVPCAR